MESAITTVLSKQPLRFDPFPKDLTTLKESAFSFSFGVARNYSGPAFVQVSSCIQGRIVEASGDPAHGSVTLKLADLVLTTKTPNRWGNFCKSNPTEAHLTWNDAEVSIRLEGSSLSAFEFSTKKAHVILALTPPQSQATEATTSPLRDASFR